MANTDTTGSRRTPLDRAGLTALAMLVVVTGGLVAPLGPLLAIACDMPRRTCARSSTSRSPSPRTGRAGPNADLVIMARDHQDHGDLPTTVTAEAIASAVLSVLPGDTSDRPCSTRLLWPRCQTRCGRCGRSRPVGAERSRRFSISGTGRPTAPSGRHGSPPETCAAQRHGDGRERREASGFSGPRSTSHRPTHVPRKIGLVNAANSRYRSRRRLVAQLRAYVGRVLRRRAPTTVPEPRPARGAREEDPLVGDEADRAAGRRWPPDGR